MINYIAIKNCFAHRNSRFEFSSGLTAITGPNWSGKSQIIEMIRFALFGSSALRTSPGDYQGAKVELGFEIRGVGYVVERTTTKATLRQGNDIKAVGVKPVNSRIVELFGYGMKVFDTANAATQGKIEALSDMGSTDRKKLVDSTVGLDTIDQLGDWCAKQASELSREAEGISSVLIEPTAPVKPEAYQPLDEARAARDRLQADVAEHKILRELLEMNPPEAVWPICEEPRDLEELETISRGRKTAMAEKIRLQNQLLVTPAPVFTAEQIDDMEVAWGLHDGHKLALDWLQSHPVPHYTDPAIPEAMFDVLETHDRWVEWERLRREGHHECPACAHRWPVRADKMAVYGDFDTEPPKPELTTLIGINRAKHVAMEYQETLKARETYNEVIRKMGDKLAPSPKTTMAELAQHKVKLVNGDRRAAIIASMEAIDTELTASPNVDDAIRVRRAYDLAFKAADEADLRRREWVINEPSRQARLAELDGCNELLSKANDTIAAILSYDQLSASYAKARAEYDFQTSRLLDLVTQAEQYGKARVALKEVKTRVKTYLVPSLSRVASSLLANMTRGRLGEVVVDEDFEITVGGVSIDGLSGAGKALSNLALRIGLGQVLTNKVFSVFAADEIDAAADQENAEGMADCLQSLTKQVGQIILVSHKTPQADHYIKL